MCLESSPDSAHAIMHSASLSSTSRKQGKKPNPTSKWKINPSACQNNKKLHFLFLWFFCFKFISWPVNTIFPSCLPTEAAKPKNVMDVCVCTFAVGIHRTALNIKGKKWREPLPGHSQLLPFPNNHVEVCTQQDGAGQVCSAWNSPFSSFRRLYLAQPLSYIHIKAH